VKLKNLAALVVRFAGALIMLGGIQALVPYAEQRNIIYEIIEVAVSLIIGYCLIYYSKKLAALFCKGLDDDDVG
jgi:hypothetical protein